MLSLIIGVAIALSTIFLFLTVGFRILSIPESFDERERL